MYDLAREQQEQAARIATLEAWAETVNSNIDALQALVEGKRFITGVAYSPDPAPGHYTITYVTVINGAAGAPETMTIHNGQKGDQGLTGHAPQIVVAKDTDDKYYWTLDDDGEGDTEWLYKPGTTEKIPVTGDKGASGNDGQAGATPKVRINSAGYWEICVSGACPDAAADGQD